jgi:NO-binding membrane sensor protein with MHYT domain
MGLEGVFMGFGLWEMKFLNMLAIKKTCKILWVPIMPEQRMLWVCEFLFYF